MHIGYHAQLLLVRTVLYVGFRDTGNRHVMAWGEGEAEGSVAALSRLRGVCVGYGLGLGASSEELRTVDDLCEEMR